MVFRAYKQLGFEFVISVQENNNNSENFEKEMFIRFRKIF